MVPLPTNRSKISRDRGKDEKGADLPARPRICIDVAAHRKAKQVAAGENVRTEEHTGNAAAGPCEAKRVRITEP